MLNILLIFFGDFCFIVLIVFMSVFLSFDVISSYAVNIVFVTLDVRRVNFFCLNFNKLMFEFMDVCMV